ncbi:hypothetical protein GV791_02070 [Nocardia cyriacigeorgica]|uniref:Uncharacterized protein n=2 Tax=Nocardia cyriacigeorgica TaxID=135487 RepID=H6RAM5_NOCCG|nr:hypothetical protein [Nocardia cyriacigeorgica]MBF6082693.1 hypothetical protein [Nocardia cyriacigeorgica]MBF6288093.1 hypothetical protein [Nocardia cyriacigeorgica]NEW31348.1 hypothetical protein [Nocardia cyriacigeorgica]CCF66236.1 conserved protein of unknown function [Nocardia cyriacigeorgica GUH-2]BDT89944.1 hypothetical protein FMUAM8_57080 [Nocardia cyriacigeorgica]
MSGEQQLPGEEDIPSGTAEVVESWEVPAGSVVASRIRDNILIAIERGYDDPQLVADLAVGPLVMAVGKLEVELAAARRRIEELERSVGDLTSGSGAGR